MSVVERRGDGLGSKHRESQEHVGVFKTAKREKGRLRLEGPEVTTAG